MGFIDWLSGGEKGKEEAKAVQGKILAKPFRISMSFTPLRLSSRKSNSVNLNITLTNVTKDPQLVSVDVMLPKNAYMGFEPSCINKVFEKRLGEIPSGQTVTVAVPIWGGTQTTPDDHEINITAYAHYIGYEKVLTYMTTKTKLRIV